MDIIIGSRARFCGRFNINAGDDENALNDANTNEDLIDTVKAQKRVAKRQLTETLYSLDKVHDERNH